MPNGDREDVADRLSKRFDDQEDDEETEDAAGTDQQASKDKSAGQSGPAGNEVNAGQAGSAENAMHVGNVKEEWESKSFYLPGFLKDDLRTTYKETDLEFETEYGESLPKTRHYYPLVVQLGIERIASMGASELKGCIADLEERGEHD